MHCWQTFLLQRELRIRTTGSWNNACRQKWKLCLRTGLWLWKNTRHAVQRTIFAPVVSKVHCHCSEAFQTPNPTWPAHKYSKTPYVPNVQSDIKREQLFCTFRCKISNNPSSFDKISGHHNARTHARTRKHMHYYPMHELSGEMWFFKNSMNFDSGWSALTRSSLRIVCSTPGRGIAVHADALTTFAVIEKGNIRLRFGYEAGKPTLLNAQQLKSLMCSFCRLAFHMYGSTTPHLWDCHLFCSSWGKSSLRRERGITVNNVTCEVHNDLEAQSATISDSSSGVRVQKFIPCFCTDKTVPLSRFSIWDCSWLWSNSVAANESD